MKVWSLDGFRLTQEKTLDHPDMRASEKGTSPFPEAAYRHLL
jgi:hypothetical protein